MGRKFDSRRIHIICCFQAYALETLLIMMNARGYYSCSWMLLLSAAREELSGYVIRDSTNSIHTNIIYILLVRRFYHLAYVDKAREYIGQGYRYKTTKERDGSRVRFSFFNVRAEDTLWANDSTGYTLVEPRHIRVPFVYRHYTHAPDHGITRHNKTPLTPRFR